MLTCLNTPVRALLLAAALTFAAHADVRAAAQEVQTTARASARTRADAPAADTQAADRGDEFPLGGVLIIVGIVGVVIVLAWVCSRFGDSR
jgi:hypothetical protein